MEAWELREQYLKSGQNEAGAKNRKRGEKGEILSASEFLKLLPDIGEPGPAADADEEAILAELENEEAEEDKETGRPADKERAEGNIEHPTSNIERRRRHEARSSKHESNPKFEVRNSGLSTQHPALSPCESSADVAARMPTPSLPSGPRYDISDELLKAWDRLVDHLRKNPDELWQRLARRRTLTLTRPPRPWCLCIRASDTRINSFTARCAPSDAAYPRSHLGPGVKFVPAVHDVAIDKSLLYKLCMPVHLPRGYNEVTEVAQLVGRSHTDIRRLVREGIFAVKRVPRLEGRWGHPVPLISVPWPLDPGAGRLQPPDPLWDHPWPLVSHVPDDFEQNLTRVPRFHPDGRRRRGRAVVCPSR